MGNYIKDNGKVTNISLPYLSTYNSDTKNNDQNVKIYNQTDTPVKNSFNDIINSKNKYQINSVYSFFMQYTKDYNPILYWLNNSSNTIGKHSLK